MADLVFSPKHEQVTILIDGDPYTLTAFLSLHDSELFVTASADNAKNVLAEYIYKRIESDNKDKLTQERVSAQPDEVFEPLIKALLSQSEMLRECYERRDAKEPLCTRFVMAVKDESRTLAAQFSETFKKLVVPMPVFPELKIVQTWSNELTKIADTIKAITAPLNDIWKSFQIPKLSDERKAEIVEAQKKWGMYGWTQPPASPMGFFCDAPLDISDANRQVASYCRDSDMQDVFDMLRKMKRTKKSDLEEAIYDFEHKQYKSCILVLFGLIDARLIRLQRDEDRNPKNNRRPVGLTASQKLFKRIEKEKDINKKVYLLFSYQNVYACLMKVFEDGGDFKKQPEVINRNFVDHGMLHRDVTKRDCIQIFLLYYNLLEFLDIVYPGTSKKEV